MVCKLKCNLIERKGVKPNCKFPKWLALLALTLLIAEHKSGIKETIVYYLEIHNKPTTKAVHLLLKNSGLFLCTDQPSYPSDFLFSILAWAYENH
jgi:hypothetical protein